MSEHPLPRVSVWRWVLALLVVAACDCAPGLRHAQPAIEVSPTVIDFGEVAVDSNVTAIVKVRNRGLGTLAVTDATLGGDADGLEILSLLTTDCDGAELKQDSPPTLAQTQCGQLTLRYTPIHRRALDATVTLKSNDTLQPEVVVAVKGFGIGPALELCAGGDTNEPEADCAPLQTDESGKHFFDFGPVPRRTTADRVLWVKSAGKTTLDVSSITIDPASDFFTVSPATMPQLQPDTAGKLHVSFSPPTPGPYTAQLHLASNDPELRQLDVELRGTGTAPTIRVCPVDDAGQVDPALCSSTTPEMPPTVPLLTFPDTAVGTESTRTLRVFNDGLAPLNIYGQSLVPDTMLFSYTVLPNPTTIDAGATLDLPVRFIPIAETLSTGTLRIENNDDQRINVDVALQGLGIGPAVRICILSEDGNEAPEFCSQLRETPPVLPGLDFGHVPWFTRITRQVRVYNVGQAPLQVATPVLSTSVTDFSFDGTPAAFGVAPGESTTLTLAFAPVSDGAVHAELQLSSNDLQSPSVAVQVDGYAEAPKLCFDPPTPLDFGTVGVGQNRQLPLVLRNCGLVPFDLKSLAIAGTAPTTTEFALSALPTYPASLPTGGTITVQAKYTPKAQRTDNATVTAVSDYQTVTTTLTGKGGAPSCAGTPPTANAGPAQTVKPLATVTLNGSASTAPNGGITYAWRFVSSPVNANPSFTTAANIAKPQFKANLVGDYVMELVVGDSKNCQSAASTVTVHVVPDKTVLVELSWAQNFGDMDLHFIGPGGTFWNSQSDVYFNNKKPDWGLNNTTAADGVTTNNASLDIDDTWGNGPENVTQAIPFDGTYKVWTHYYCSRTCFFFSCSGSYGAATATIRVYINGVKKYEGSQSMTQRDIWEAATITVAGTNVTVTPLTTALYKSSNSQGCTSAGN